MNNLKVDTIIFEGIDKTGKDTIIKYVNTLCKYKYAVYQRGAISNTVYNKIYNRDSFVYSIKPNTLYVLLEADINDLNVRFKINNEPNIDIPLHLQVFNETFTEMTEGCPRLYFNTSKMNIYDIAKCIVDTMEQLNN